jgi:zinc transporter ZupT
MLPPPDSHDQSALEAFTNSVPRESLAARRERSEAGAKRVKQALWRIQSYSLCVGVGAAMATLIQRPMPLLPGIYIAVGAILGAVAGSVVFVLYTLVSYLRWGGWLSEKRVDVVPTIWRYGPIGAIGGCMLMTLAINNSLEKGNADPTLPTLLGGIGGFLVCAVARFVLRCATRHDGAAIERRFFWP